VEADAAGFEVDGGGLVVGVVGHVLADYLFLFGHVVAAEVAVLGVPAPFVAAFDKVHGAELGVDFLERDPGGEHLGAVAAAPVVVVLVPGDVGGFVTACRFHENLFVPEADGGRVEELGGELADTRVDDGVGEDGVAPVGVVDFVEGVGVVTGAPEAGEGFAAGLIAAGVDFVDCVGQFFALVGVEELGAEPVAVFCEAGACLLVNHYLRYRHSSFLL